MLQTELQNKYKICTASQERKSFSIRFWIFALKTFTSNLTLTSLKRDPVRQTSASADRTLPYFLKKMFWKL
ncbi:MAG: hypothetical protein IJI42_06380 [Methanobrevibacter sp.]|nr:hypothetical protein [Methanobrevibacter sp.]